MHLSTTRFLAETLVCVGLGFLVSWLSIDLIFRHEGQRRNRVDDFHHSPGTPVFRMGGLALVAGLIAVLLAVDAFGLFSGNNERTLLTILAGATLMFGLGLWDDFKALDGRFKLIMQSIIAAGVYAAGIRIDFLRNPITGGDEVLGIPGFFLTVAWLVALPNMINLIDGMDGLAAGVSLMLMILLAHLGLDGNGSFALFLALGVAGSLLAFLRFNYPPARIYMGDGGAYLLGFLIGVLSIVNSNKGTMVAALIAPAFALALPIADVVLAILRRTLHGLPIFRPDRKHIHHQLLIRGFSRAKALLALYAISLIFLVLAFEVFWMEGRFLSLFAGLAFLVMVLAGHLCGIWDWSQAGTLIRNSFLLRRESRYALALARCLESQAARCGTFNELWQNYESLLTKLGFSQVCLLLAADIQACWQSPSVANEIGVSAVPFRLSMRDGSSLDFSWVSLGKNDLLFRLRAEIAAEAWHKALLKWTVVREQKATFATTRIKPGLSLSSTSYLAADPSP